MLSNIIILLTLILIAISIVIRILIILFKNKKNNKSIDIDKFVSTLKKINYDLEESNKTISSAVKKYKKNKNENRTKIK